MEVSMSVDITLQDGVSGLATGAQEGKALLTGYCSKGVPGKAYYIGASTDISDLLGAGPLVDRLKDVFSVTDDAVVIAVPVATNIFDSTRKTLIIDSSGIVGEKTLNETKVITDVGDGVFEIHKHAYGMTVNVTVDDNGTVSDSYLQEGSGYQYDASTGQFSLDLELVRVPAEVSYESTSDGNFSGIKEFIENRMEIPADATNLVVKVELDAVMTSWLTLHEWTDYTRDNGSLTLLATKDGTDIRLGTYTLVGTIEDRYSSGKALLSLVIVYFYSLYAQGNKEIALPKYVANVEVTATLKMPDNTYSVSYDPTKECNVLRIESVMPESLRVTWEDINEIDITKSRESAPDIQVLGTGKIACQVTIKYNSGGGGVPVFSGGSGGVVQGSGPVILSETNWSVANYQISYDGESFGESKKVPYDGRIELEKLGISILVPETPLLAANDTYSFLVDEPTLSYTDVMNAIEGPLALNDVEFVAVCGAMPSDAWSVFAQKADELWQKHRPTFFLLEYRTPANDETIDNWVSVLLAERVQFAHPFLACCVAYGNVSGNTRNLMGLLAGRLLSIPVMRSIGRVRDGGLATVQLPDGYNESHQQTLEDAGYITAKTITGLKNPYFGSARTLAEDTSDFRYIEILRVVFKACRLARIRALNSIHDEAGDPLLGSDASGVAYLKSNIESAVGTMKTAAPQEIVDFVISIPKGQDIVNNGLRLGLRLIGIPIIRELEIFASYTYAGSTFDPRLEAVS
jgi:hypothetical protein